MGRTLTISQVTPCLLLLPLLAHVLFTEWWVNVKATGTLDPMSLSNITVGQSLTPTTASLQYDPFTNICLTQTQLTPSQSGVIYALQISPHHSLNISTGIHIIQVRGWPSDLWPLNPDLTIINSVPITIASPDSVNNFIYYFNSSQLLEVEPNDLLGYCFGPRPFFLKDTSAPPTDSYTWTPTSLSIGTVTPSTNITVVYDYSLNLQFLQWNANLTDLNMTLFDNFYSHHRPPVFPPIIGVDPFYLPTTLLGDIIPTDASIQTSTTPNICIVPNVPVSEPTLVYAFKGSTLYYSPYGPFVLKLAHLRILNPSTIIPDVSTTTVVKLIQSIDLTIATTDGDYTSFYYQLPADQFFFLQSGDYIGYCINDTIAQWYFNYGYSNGGHSFFSFDLDYSSQEVSLSSGVYDFNAVGWANVTTRDQFNSDELGVFLDRGYELNSFARATYISGAGPFNDSTAPVLTPPILTPAETFLDPSTLPESHIGSLVSSTLYDLNDGWCTVIKPTIGPGIVYGLRSSRVPALAQDTTITILYGYENYHSHFSITNEVSIVIPASTTATQFEYFFTYEQLFPTVSPSSYDGVIGWCTPASQPGVFAYVAGSSDPTIYQWAKVSYQSDISSTYQDHRRYDFELLQWADISQDDLNETATRQFLTQMAIHSNSLRPNTYNVPSLIDPTTNSDFDYLYGYQYSSYDGSWITPSMDSQLSSPTCVLFDYSDYGNLSPSVLYWVSASQIAAANHTVNLTLIIARDDSVFQDKSLFTTTQVRNVPIPPSDSASPLIYYFPPDQLLQVNAGDYLGYCDHGDDILSYYPTSLSYGYEWTSDGVDVDSLISSPRSSYQRVDLQVHGWKDLKINQLNLTAIDQFLTAARQAAGSARGVTTPTDPSDSPSSSGGLSSSGRTALIVCMVLFGVGLITCLIIARSMRRRSPAPAPISQPPNQHLPSAAANGRIQPKPAIAASSPSPSPIRVQAAASSLPAPLRNPYQPQPIIYRGNQEGIRINLSPSAPPNPYIYPSPSTILPPPSVSPSAAVSSSSSIELLPLSRPPVSLSSIENDIPNQPPPQYDGPTINEVEVEGQANVNIHLDPPPPSQPLVPEVCQPHEPFSPIQPVLMYPPTNVSQISSPSSPLVYSAPRQPSYPTMALSASSSLTPIPGGMTPTTAASVDEKRFCEQCGRPKTSKMAIFCSGCGTKY